MLHLKENSLFVCSRHCFQDLYDAAARSVFNPCSRRLYLCIACLLIVPRRRNVFSFLFFNLISAPFLLAPRALSRLAFRDFQFQSSQVRPMPFLIVTCCSCCSPDTSFTCIKHDAHFPFFALAIEQFYLLRGQNQRKTE